MLWSGSQATGSGLSVNVPGLKDSELIAVFVWGGSGATVLFARQYGAEFFGSGSEITADSVTAATVIIAHSGDTITSLGYRAPYSTSRTISKIVRIL